jgi:hypothetical protein
MSERSAVQNPMLRYAEQIGWTYIPADQALRMRGGDTGLFLTDVLRDQPTRFDSGVLDAARSEDTLRRLAELYGLVRKAYGDLTYVDKELAAKTRDLLRAHTEGDRLELPGAHALGPAELAALRESDATETTKILNLRKVLAVKVREEGGSKPFLLSIGERAEALAQAYEDRL